MMQRIASVRRSLLTAAALFCTVPMIGASCVSEGGDTTSSRDDTSVADIPSDARLVTQGRGSLSFRAGSNGRVYVYDSTEREIRYTDDLLEGDTFAVNAADDRVYVNNKKSAKLKLKDENNYRLYFDGRGVRDRDADRSPDRGQDRNQNRNDRDVARPVPDNAKIVDEARGRDLSFKAGDDGKAFLYDVSSSKLLNTYTLRRGQRLTISPANGAVAIDGKTVAKGQSLDRRTTYRLFFAK